MIRRLAVVAVGIALLSGCAAGTAETTVSGEVITAVTLTVDRGPAEERPDQMQALTDGEWLEICRGNQVLIAGTTSWFYEPAVGRVELEGSQITVRDAEGAIAGLPSLTLTSATSEVAGVGRCEWSFVLEGFSSESEFFSIEVEGVPGEESVSRADLLAGLSLSVG